MAGRRSDRVVRQLHRLFNVGAAGSMSDPQLLDQIVSRREQAAEAAFEELMVRHGPMVLRVCRSVLKDAHDAEDAFQAVFIVLANRAKAIRQSRSIASWLFGVAHRVAIQGKRSAARRRGLHERIAGRTAESYLPKEHDFDSDILHDEIQGLPEQLRAPIVLCYLEELSYSAAAHELGLSEAVIRGRLVRARDRLRQRLIKRGVTVPAGVLVAGAAGQAQAAIPATLIHATTRVACGFMVGNTASILARGVLNAMLLDRLRVAAALVCLGIGGSYWAWSSLAAAVDEKTQADPAQAIVRTRAVTPTPKTDRYGDPLPAGAVMRLGTVRFRQAQSIRNIVYSPDGRLVVTGSGQHVLLLCDAQDGKMLRQLDLPSEDVRAFAFSPDGTTIAAVGFRLDPMRNVVVNELTIIEVATGRIVRRSAWDDQESVENVAYAAGGKTVATVSLDGTLRLWDAAAANLQHVERLTGDRRISPESIAFSPSAASGLLAITAGPTIDLWDVTQHRRVRTIALDRNYRPNCLVFSPDGTTLAAGVAKRGAEIRLWRAADGALIGSLKSRKNAHVSHMAYSPDGKVLAAIGSGGPLVFFDITTGKELDNLSSVRLADGPLAFSPDGITLATTGDRQSLHFWEPATGKDRLATPEAHVGDVAALAWLNNGKTLVSGSRDRTVRIWDQATGRPTRMLAHDGWVESLAVSADGKILVTGSSYPESAKVQVWNPTTGERIHIWSVEGTKAGLRFLRGVTLTEDNPCVIAAFGDGALQGWDVSTGKERPIVQPKLEEFPSMGPGGGLTGVDRAVFSRDGRSAAMIAEGRVQVIDVASGQRRFKESLAMMGQCEFAPDGRSLALIRVANERFRAGRWRGSTITASTIVWLDSLTGHVRREIAIPESGVRSLTFSPDGQAIAVGTLSTHPERGFIRIFRLVDKKEVQTIESPCPFIEVLAFTPDGKKIAAGLGDTSIVIWDLHPEKLRRDRPGYFAVTDLFS